MDSHMGVQRLATRRNTNVESFVQFILQGFFEALHRTGEIRRYEIMPHTEFKSRLASDVWDFCCRVELDDARVLELWCQITCYKGNKTGKPEPNKTYEIRETFTEAITIRDSFRESETAIFRSLHITVGDMNYTYSWFPDVKSSAFDKSLYLWDRRNDLFKYLDSALRSCITEEEILSVLSSKRSQSENVISVLDSSARKELLKWWRAGIPRSDLAHKQWLLTKDRRNMTYGSWSKIAKIEGSNIKGQAVRLMQATREKSRSADALIQETAKSLFEKNPFLAAAQEALTHWDQVIVKIRAIEARSSSFEDFITRLWVCELPLRLVLRRILLRIHSEASINYIQDLPIEGITEHNLYSGDLNERQLGSITKVIVGNLTTSGITANSMLLSAFVKRGKKLLNMAKWFEGKNGTSLKPSFQYLKNSLLSAGYKTQRPAAVGISVLGYHANLTKSKVKEYTTILAVISPNGKPICLIKGMFFRDKEFPRRVKEQSFVGLTLRYSCVGDRFNLKQEYPLILFVDMPENYIPPQHSIECLLAFGWVPFFRIQDLLGYLRNCWR